VQHGIERRLAGQRDRRRRQAIARVRVVRGIGVKIALGQIAVEPFANPVDQRRIRLQPHALLQAIDEHRRDERPIRDAAGFLLHD
jgi:hypothetical protein